MEQPLLQLDTLRRAWVDESVAWFIAHNFQFDELTSDDLHGKLPEPPHANYYGSLLAALKKLGHVRKLGYRVSTRPSANCRPVSLWQTV